jgi:hypothetical protein
MAIRNRSCTYSYCITVKLVISHLIICTGEEPILYCLYLTDYDGIFHQWSYHYVEQLGTARNGSEQIIHIIYF